MWGSAAEERGEWRSTLVVLGLHRCDLGGAPASSRRKKRVLTRTHVASDMLGPSKGGVADGALGERRDGEQRTTTTKVKRLCVRHDGEDLGELGGCGEDGLGDGDVLCDRPPYREGVGGAGVRWSWERRKWCLWAEKAGELGDTMEGGLGGVEDSQRIEEWTGGRKGERMEWRGPIWRRRWWLCAELCESESHSKSRHNTHPACVVAKPAPAQGPVGT